MKSNRELYLSYVNKYLSIEGFANGHGLSINEAKAVIQAGRIEHNQHADTLNRYDLKSARETVEARHVMTCAEYLILLALVSFYIYCILTVYSNLV